MSRPDPSDTGSAVFLRTFTGHFEALVDKGLRKRCILWVEIPAEDRDDVEQALGPSRHRSKNIPIALAIGRSAEALATMLPGNKPRPKVAPVDLGVAAAPVPSPAKIRIGELVSRIAYLQVRRSLYADAAAGASDLQHIAVARDAGDKTDLDLVKTIDALNDVIRDLTRGGR